MDSFFWIANKLQFLIFQILKARKIIINYFYNKEAEGGLIYNDEHLAIDWKLDQKDISLSEKDRVQPAFGDHKPAL